MKPAVRRDWSRWAGGAMCASMLAAVAAAQSREPVEGSRPTEEDDPGARVLSALEALRDALGPEEPFVADTPVYGMDEPGQLEPFVVWELREVEPPRPEMRVPPMRLGLRLNLKMAMGWPEMRGPSFQTAARTPQRPAYVATTAQVYTAVSFPPGLESAVARRVGEDWTELVDDDRRSRGEPLVVWDGVPLNDPFDGVIPWSRVPRLELARVEHAPLGGATAWGPGGGNGVVQLFSRPLEAWSRADANGDGESAESEATNGLIARLRLTGEVLAQVGDHGRRSIEVSNTQTTARGVLQVSGGILHSEGYYRVAPEDRGDVDQRAWLRERWVSARWRQPVGATTEALLTLRGAEESRGHGTIGQTEQQREQFVSLQLAGRVGPTFAWTGIVNAQDQTRRRSRTVVSPARNEETPTSELVDVPVTALGVLWTGAWWREADARTVVGVDARVIRGESREHRAFDAVEFTRELHAGGSERQAGVFALHDFVLPAQLRATLGVRADHWADSDGHRRDRERFAPGGERDEEFPRRSGTELYPSAGLVWRPTASWRARVAMQEAFRLATLSERYVSVVRDDGERLESNPYLRNERSRTWEAGFDCVLPRRTSRTAQTTAVDAVKHEDVSASSGSIGVVVYRTEWRDGIASPAVAAAGNGSGDFVRQWTNWDRARTEGLRVFTTWRPASRVAIDADVRFEEATVRIWRDRAELEGNRLARHARTRGTVGVAWQALAAVTVNARLHVVGRRFDDEENMRPLGRAVTLDLHVSRPLGKRATLYVALENAGDARVETMRDRHGLVRLGAPRSFGAGVQYAW